MRGPLHRGYSTLGAKIELTVAREGREIRLQATLTAAPELAARSEVRGVGLLDGVVFAASPSGGVTIVSVDPASKAGQAGLAERDVIVSIDQEPVQSVDDVLAMAGKHEDILLLGVEHDGSARLLVIR